MKIVLLFVVQFWTIFSSIVSRSHTFIYVSRYFSCYSQLPITMMTVKKTMQLAIIFGACFFGSNQVTKDRNQTQWLLCNALFCPEFIEHWYLWQMSILIIVTITNYHFFFFWVKFLSPNLKSYSRFMHKLYFKSLSTTREQLEHNSRFRTKKPVSGAPQKLGSNEDPPVFTITRWSSSTPGLNKDWLDSYCLCPRADSSTQSVNGYVS